MDSVHGLSVKSGNKVGKTWFSPPLLWENILIQLNDGGFKYLYVKQPCEIKGPDWSTEVALSFGITCQPNSRNNETQTCIELFTEGKRDI